MAVRTDPFLQHIPIKDSCEIWAQPKHSPPRPAPWSLLRHFRVFENPETLSVASARVDHVDLQPRTSKAHKTLHHALESRAVRPCTQVTASAGLALVELLESSKRTTNRTTAVRLGTAPVEGAAAAAEQPVRSLLDYAAWAVSRAGGGASDARLAEELSSVGEAARRLQVWALSIACSI